MVTIQTLKDVQALIDNAIEESATLEYKAKLSANKDIAKDICAFANSQGGTIIYGVMTKDRIPTELIWITEEHAEERVRNVLEHSVQPTIEGVDVDRLPNPNAVGQAVLVIRVPASMHAPHMVDSRYYKRRGSVSSPMDHDEVKSAMLGSGRNVALHFEISANIRILDKMYSLLQGMSESGGPSKVPNLALIPLHTDAWRAIVAGGFLFSFSTALVEQLVEAYSAVHEINSLIEWHRTQGGIIMVTPVYDSSFKHGTYVPAVIRDKAGRLRNQLIKLSEGF